MINSQTRAPLWEVLVEYISKNRTSFHTPGHKSGRSLDQDILNGMGSDFFKFDLTELPDLDNLHFPQGPILEAQKLAAAACGSRKSFFLVNGSTCGIQAMILTTCNPGDKLIIPRDSHVSVHHALIIAGVEPIYIYPEVSPEGLILGITREQLRIAIENNPEAVGVLLINPNYFGICSDLCGLIKEAKNCNKFVLVDEAHGAHLPYNKQLPTSASAAGADLWVQSTHKMISGLTQTAILHAADTGLSMERLKNSLRLVQSTSPSFLLLASIDIARRQMAIDGNGMLDNLIKLSLDLRKKLGILSGLKCFNEDDLPRNRGYSLDPLKLVISFSKLKGTEAAHQLRRDYRLECELADEKYILFMLGPGTSEKDLQHLYTALAELSANADSCFEDVTGLNNSCGAVLNKDCDAGVSNQIIYVSEFDEGWISPETKKSETKCWGAGRQIMKPREAWFTQSVSIPSPECTGRISGEFVTPYPPGIPIICPGEEITPEKALIIQANTPNLKVLINE